MARIKSKTSVICDAGPIIHLDEIGCVHLLRDFNKIIVPQKVRKEVLRHQPEAFSDSGVPWEYFSPSFPLEEPLRTMCKVFSLDAGEVEALAILSKETEFMFLTDDAAARLVATRIGFNVHGTIGVLIRAIRRGLLKPEDVLDILLLLPTQSTLYIKSSVLNEIIQRIKDEFNI